MGDRDLDRVPIVADTAVQRLTYWSIYRRLLQSLLMAD